MKTGEKPVWHFSASYILAIFMSQEQQKSVSCFEKSLAKTTSLSFVYFKI